jgi:outer membrane receptor protein involved in Fe transport
MFTEDVFGQFTVYFKDIYGLLTIEDVRAGDSPTLVSQYTNKDYASSRGFEISVTKRFTRNFACELDYTYGVSTGVASDPNIQQQVEFLYLPISEQPLNGTSGTRLRRPRPWLARRLAGEHGGPQGTDSLHPWYREQRKPIRS